MSNEKETDNSLNMSMVMALAQACGITPQKFAESFYQNSKNLDYLREFTAHCATFMIDELKKKSPVKSPLQVNS